MQRNPGLLVAARIFLSLGAASGCGSRAATGSDAGVDAAPDAAVCLFEASYTFHDDGGLRAFVDTSTLTPPRSHLITRAGGRAGAPGSCVRDVPCTASAAVSVSAIEVALADADVRAALAKPKGMLYGSDPRPIDGTVWVFTRDDGQDFTVGSGDVPAGLRALETLLQQLTTETLAAPECAALAP